MGPCSRFDSLDWASPGFAVHYQRRSILAKGTVLCFVDDPMLGSSPSRWFTPIHRSQLDFDMILYWISYCDGHNDSKCYVGFEYNSDLNSCFTSIRVMRFIDVEKTAFCRYIALSYVWSSVLSLRLTQANRTRLMEDGALRVGWGLVTLSLPSFRF